MSPPTTFCPTVERGLPFSTAVHDELKACRAEVEIKGFDLWYGAKQALFGIDMAVPHGAVTALIGPSGCGKSTLLRSVNRMNDLILSVRYGGDMLLSGDPIYSKDTDVIELRKRIGVVFQKPNPFPKSVYENVAWGGRIQGFRGKMDDLVESCLRQAALWDEVRIS